jgi:hypothetical protein
LVGIEPASMTAVFCHDAADRKAETWRQRLRPFGHREFVVSDAAKGIAAAVEQVAEQRREKDPSAPPLGHGLDLFHTTQEAERVLAQEWRRVEPLWEAAEACDAEVEHAKRQGTDARHGEAQTAHAAWSKAIAEFERVEHLEAAWRRCRAAFELFHGDGRLNDRARAEEEIAAGLVVLCGPEWKKVGDFLRDRRSLSFLDRMHQRLAAAEPRTEWRAVLAWRWWRLRSGASGTNPLAALVFAVAVHRPLEGAERAAYDRIEAILVSTFRASSAVECMNSVLRMQQSRHKRMTQPMLDLKRLYWNSHVLKAGKRKGQCPYQKLGLPVSTFDFWELLQSDPARLAQELSGPKVTP